MRLLKSVDEGVGRILRTLAQEGVLDQTAVILTSDNGFFLREHGLRDKRWAYEEAIRIPLLVRYPPLTRPGARIDQIVLNVDLAPTLLELGGVPVPAEVHGRSFLPLLKGKKEGWRDMFAAEYFRESRFPRTPTWEALRTERWKYIRYPELGMEYDELYNLRSDPYELRNVVNDMRLTDLLERLRKRLTRLLTFPPRAAFDDSALSSSSPVLLLSSVALTASTTLLAESSGHGQDRCEAVSGCTLVSRVGREVKIFMRLPDGRNVATP